MEQQFAITTARIGQVGLSWLSGAGTRRCIQMKLIGNNLNSVRFPGAVNSKFTTNMAFINPSDMPNIPTYRIMDSDGELVQKDRQRPVNVSNEEILTWYKNMLTGAWLELVAARLWMETDKDISSERHGCDHVRSTKAGSFEFLYGMH